MWVHIGSMLDEPYECWINVVDVESVLRELLVTVLMFDQVESN